MVRKSKRNNTVIGLLFLFVGFGLVAWAYQMSGSFGSQLNQAFSGSPSDKVLMAYIGATASVLAGLYFLSRK